MLNKLETDRLILRFYELEDAAEAQRLAGEKVIAETTFIPYPYTLEIAKEWIKSHAELIKNGKYPYAVTLKESGQLIGTMSIRVDKTHQKGELAYWIGREYWGNGYATEAAEIVMELGFNTLNLNRVFAPILSKNNASIKVMQKIGMNYEGTLKQDLKRFGKFEDVDIYGIVKSELEK